MKKMFYVWWFEVRCIVCSGRWLVLSLMSFLLLRLYLANILQFTKDYELPAVPAALPFLFADGTFNSLGMLLLVFLVSAFPICNQIQQNVLGKSGSFIWETAQMLTIITTVALWILEMQVFVMVLFGRNLSFGGWGKVWGSMASGVSQEMGYSGGIHVSDFVIMNYNPIQAIGMSMLLMFLTGVIFGMLVFLLDGISRNYIGEILLVFWSLFCLTTANFPAFFKIAFIRKISPVTWMNLESYITEPQNFGKILVLLAAILLVLYVLNYIIVKKKWLVLD